MMATSITTLSSSSIPRVNVTTRRSAIRASAAPKSTDGPVSRRGALKIGTSALQLLVASEAWALIPGNDDEDEECVFKCVFGQLIRSRSSLPWKHGCFVYPSETHATQPYRFLRRLLAKAKAGRAQRIQAERALEKNYVTKNDLKLDADTSKVQVAVFKLSKAGGLIQSGYLALASEALGQGSWETEFRDAGLNLGKDPKEFLDALADLKNACANGDAVRAKKTYVAAARSLETFAVDTKTADNLKLL